MQTKSAKTNKNLPRWAWWLIGWAAVLALAAALVYFWRAVFLLDGVPALPLTLGVMGLFSLVYLAVFFISRVREKGFTGRAALLVFLCGLLFCVATAPLQAPDEQNHFLRAASISMGRFTYDYNEDYPDDVDLLLEQFPHQMNHKITYQNHDMAPQALTEYKDKLAAGETAETQAGAPIMFMLLPFLPQALFMAVARLFGFSALGMMYAGRIANLVVYSLLCWLAFRNCSRYRGVFYGVALLPLGLFMAGSCNYDGVMLGLCYVLASFVCRDKMDNRGVILFCLALAVAVYIKPNNLLFAGVLLLIPKQNWKASCNRWVALGVSVAAMALLYFGLGQGIDGGVLKQNWPDQVLQDARGGGDGAAPADQLMYMLRYPFKFISVALLSVLEGNGFLFDMGRLGAMDLSLPMIGGLSAMALLACSVFSARAKEETSKKVMIGLGVLVLLYGAAILAGMYVTDTDYQAVRISGLQPRYFLPAFLLLFVLCSMVFGRVLKPKLGTDGTAVLRGERLCLYIGVALALVAVLLLFQNYYIGQWIPKSEGGYRLVNLLT